MTCPYRISSFLGLQIRNILLVVVTNPIPQSALFTWFVFAHDEYSRCQLCLLSFWLIRRVHLSLLEVRSNSKGGLCKTHILFRSHKQLTPIKIMYGLSNMEYISYRVMSFTSNALDWKNFEFLPMSPIQYLSYIIIILGIFVLIQTGSALRAGRLQ